MPKESRAKRLRRLARATDADLQAERLRLRDRLQVVAGSHQLGLGSQTYNARAIREHRARGCLRQLMDVEAEIRYRAHLLAWGL